MAETQLLLAARLGRQWSTVRSAQWDMGQLELLGEDAMNGLLGWVQDAAGQLVYWPQLQQVHGIPWSSPVVSSLVATCPHLTHLELLDRGFHPQSRQPASLARRILLSLQQLTHCRTLQNLTVEIRLMRWDLLYLHPLSSLTQLSELHLRLNLREPLSNELGCMEVKDVASMLTPLTQLRRLQLQFASSDSPPYPAQPWELGPLGRLEHLGVYHSHTRGRELPASLAGCTSLTHLCIGSLHGFDWSNETPLTSLLEPLHLLRHLQLVEEDPDLDQPQYAIDTFLHCKLLTHLDVPTLRTPALPQPLLPELRVLRIRHSMFDCQHFHLLQMTNLTRLHVFSLRLPVCAAGGSSGRPAGGSGRSGGRAEIAGGSGGPGAAAGQGSSPAASASGNSSSGWGSSGSDSGSGSGSGGGSSSGGGGSSSDGSGSGGSIVSGSSSGGGGSSSSDGGGSSSDGGGSSIVSGSSGGGSGSGGSDSGDTGTGSINDGERALAPGRSINDGTAGAGSSAAGPSSAPDSCHPPPLFPQLLELQVGSRLENPHGPMQSWAPRLRLLRCAHHWTLIPARLDDHPCLTRLILPLSVLTITQLELLEWHAPARNPSLSSLTLVLDNASLTQPEGGCPALNPFLQWQGVREVALWDIQHGCAGRYLSMRHVQLLLQVAPSVQVLKLWGSSSQLHGSCGTYQELAKDRGWMAHVGEALLWCTSRIQAMPALTCIEVDPLYLSAVSPARMPYLTAFLVALSSSSSLKCVRLVQHCLRSCVSNGRMRETALAIERETMRSVRRQVELAQSLERLPFTVLID